MFHFYTSWKRQKTSGFMTYSEGIEMEISLKWVEKSEVHEVRVVSCELRVTSCELKA